MPRSRATSTPERAAAPAPPFHTFLCGKGGVGKTTCAAALAITLARSGLRTLVVSIDPAPSLGDALGQRLGCTATRVRGVARLHAVELDAAGALTRWLSTRRATFETIALRGTWLDREDVSRLLGLSLPGVDEIAALLELAGLSRDDTYDRIVVDTAPTGHFLRLLGLPELLRRLSCVFDDMQAKHRVLTDALRGRWTPDAADALIEELGRDAASMAALLQSPDRSALWWVSLPEAMSVEETADATRWLEAHRFTVARVIANRVTPAPRQACSWCRARRHGEALALSALKRAVGPRIPIVSVAAVDREPRGVRGLVPIGRVLSAPRAPALRVPGRAPAPVTASTPTKGGILPSALLAPPGTRLLLFGGKGGVGKTTCAAAFAIQAARAERRRRVLLLSTDPAHSVADALGKAVTNAARPASRSLPNLLVRELDAGAAYARFRARFIGAIEELFERVSGAGAADTRIAADDREVMGDLIELAPPGVDELVAIIEVTDALREGAEDPWDLIVMDTAPTGHALRLLEMPSLVHQWVKAVMAILLKYQPVVGLGELGRVLLRLSKGLGHLREMLGDSRRTRFVVVTRAAALPRAEALRLLQRLQAGGIDAPAILINAAGAGSCTRCSGERLAQRREIADLLAGLRRLPGAARFVVTAPAALPPPHGITGLARWRDTWRRVQA